MNEKVKFIIISSNETLINYIMFGKNENLKKKKIEKGLKTGELILINDIKKY